MPTFTKSHCHCTSHDSAFHQLSILLEQKWCSRCEKPTKLHPTKNLILSLEVSLSFSLASNKSVAFNYRSGQSQVDRFCISRSFKTDVNIVVSMPQVEKNDKKETHAHTQKCSDSKTRSHNKLSNITVGDNEHKVALVTLFRYFSAVISLQS